MRNFIKSNLAVALMFGAVLAGCSSAAEKNANGKLADDVASGKSNVVVNKITEVNSEKTSTNTVQNKTENPPAMPAQCKLTKAPTLNGFSLGQTVEEVGSRVSNFKTAYEKEKKGSLYKEKVNFVVVNSGGLSQTGATNKEFDDLSLIWHFLDDKLIGLVVRYIDDETSDTKAFVSKIAKENNLPQDGWKFGREQDASLTCQGFEVIASTHPQNGPSIMLFDTAGQKEKEKREKQ